MIGHFGLAFRTVIEFRAQKAISEVLLRAEEKKSPCLHIVRLFLLTKKIFVAPVFEWPAHKYQFDHVLKTNKKE
jgi:hypothetical protein